MHADANADDEAVSGTFVRGGSLYIGTHWQELQYSLAGTEYSYIRKCT